MPDPNPTGDAGKIDVAAIVKTVTDQVLEANKAAFAEFGKNLKIVADTLTEQGKTLGALQAQKNVTEDQLNRAVASALDADRRTQKDSADQKATREAFVKDAKNGLAKLPAEYTDKLGADPAKWPDEAKAIVERWEGFVKSSGITVPNVGGGANRDGGQPPADQPKTTANNKFLPENTSKQADAIKLPTKA